MNKKIIFTLLALILIATGFYFINMRGTTPSEPSITQGENPEQPEGNQPSEPSKSEPLTPEKEVIKNEAWALFQKYLTYNKENNLAGVKNSVYKISDVCDMEVPNQECKDRMQSAYSYGSVLESKEFKNVWYDEKQIILSTDFWTESSEEMGAYGRFRAIIFFVKDESGNWKMLSFSPFKGSITTSKEFGDNAENQAKIQSEDVDQDGMADYEEKCLDKNKTNCAKTDPTRRDSDGDGWWDGVQALRS